MYEMADFLADGKMITAWTPPDDDLGDGDLLAPNHAYAVLQVNTSNGMILLYNPWGNDAKGDTAQGLDDGLIWVSYDYFNYWFTDTVVAS
jgi:hypothetical protein